MGATHLCRFKQSVEQNTEQASVLIKGLSTFDNALTRCAALRTSYKILISFEVMHRDALFDRERVGLWIKDDFFQLLDINA